MLYMYIKNVNGVSNGYCHLPPPTVRNVDWIYEGPIAYFLCPVSSVLADDYRIVTTDKAHTLESCCLIPPESTV